MGSLVRSEKARQSCTTFWQQVLAPCPAARGGGFHAVCGSAVWRCASARQCGRPP